MIRSKSLRSSLSGPITINNLLPGLLRAMLRCRLPGRRRAIISSHPQRPLQVTISSRLSNLPGLLRATTNRFRSSRPIMLILRQSRRLISSMLRQPPCRPNRTIRI